MHGLLNRAIEGYLCETFGRLAWESICADAGLGFSRFESLEHYDDAITERLLAAAVARLGRSRAALLEDMGTYLVVNPRLEGLRRLLRFGGATFGDFILSLEDLPYRGRLALPELSLPALICEETGPGRFELTTRWHLPGYSAVFTGILRAMADDYGTLVMIDAEERAAPDGRTEVICVRVLDGEYSRARDFHLSGQPA